MTATRADGGINIMPVEYSYSNSGIKVVVTGSGVVSGQDILDLTSEIYSHELVPNLRRMLVDLTAVEQFCMSPDSIREIAKKDKEEAY